MHGLERGCGAWGQPRGRKGPADSDVMSERLNQPNANLSGAFHVSLYPKNAVDSLRNFVLYNRCNAGSYPSRRPWTGGVRGWDARAAAAPSRSAAPTNLTGDQVYP